MSEPVMAEEHEALLKTALKLEESDTLPQGIVDLYWEAARTARRLGSPLTTHEIVLVCLLANKASRPDPVSFLDRTDTQRGDRVLAKFRNEWRWGTFRRIDKRSRRVIVALDDDNGSDEREFTPTAVTLPSREELKAIGEA